MPRFDWWFGIDLNEPATAEDGTAFQDGEAGSQAGPTAAEEPDETGGLTVAHAHSGAHIGVTLPSEDSGSDGEVQSTPKDLF